MIIFLNIKTVNRHHVKFYEWISKMVPAIFSFAFQGQGQRSKVTALEYMGPLIMSLFFGSFSVKRSPKPGYTDSRYLTATLNVTFK